MKWDKENKQRLKDALFNKALKISGLSLENFVVYGPSGHDEFWILSG